eukprot:TRINITY_DN9081_c0_g1_i2.p1 TRINITY_DN9081_c0_g1~~TRINITY_DN9081_c0_g1_i2.p1  ORF type:complete len:316 (+),score=27.58 TRINITY_DN9081_c0_g1_i2:90-950(+)
MSGAVCGNPYRTGYADPDSFSTSGATPPNMPGTADPVFRAQQGYARSPQVSRPIGYQTHSTEPLHSRWQTAPDGGTRPRVGAQVTLCNMRVRQHLEGRSGRVIMHDSRTADGVRVQVGGKGSAIEQVDVTGANYRCDTGSRPSVGAAVRLRDLVTRSDLNGEVGVVAAHDPHRDDGLVVEMAKLGQMHCLISNVEWPVTFDSSACTAAVSDRAASISPEGHCSRGRASSARAKPHGSPQLLGSPGVWRGGSPGSLSMADRWRLGSDDGRSLRSAAAAPRFQYDECA